MINHKALLQDLSRQVEMVSADLAEQAPRPLDSDQVTQAAAAWVLGTVFVRFCEDNELIAEPFLSGSTAHRMVAAEARHRRFISEDPARTSRDWLLAAFASIGSSSIGRSLFDARNNPLYNLKISHEAAQSLINFWRTRDRQEGPIHGFVDPSWDTRFLSDLYQDLSASARGRYGLQQTPDFIEEFLLDRTLIRAVEEFGYDATKVIDPTCGSGALVVGAFRRLFSLWSHHEPQMNASERSRRALSQVHGVDSNAFAVAITRFRLLIAAMVAGGVRTLVEADGYRWPLQVAVGDSLLGNRHEVLFSEGQVSKISGEDLDQYPGILQEGRYHAVVGYPPSSTVPDKALSRLYRHLYPAATGKFPLSVPFAQRYFALARRPDKSGRGAGYVGQFTVNSFMKREFGRKLIEDFFAHEVDLTEIIDTSGAYIPGHSAPTVILIGRPRHATRYATPILAVVGLRGEHEIPAEPGQGTVWQSILKAAGQPGYLDKWTRSFPARRSDFDKFPWSLSEPEESMVLAALATARTINNVAVRVGYQANTGADEIFTADPAAFRRLNGRHPGDHPVVGVVTGSEVRDWIIGLGQDAFYPRDADRRLIDITRYPGHLRRLWPYRAILEDRPNQWKTFLDDGRSWYDWRHVADDGEGTHPWSIVFPWVSTHPHFATILDGRVALTSAPVIKLAATATTQDFAELAAVLNSSTVAFWLKQHSNSKGQPKAEQLRSSEPWTTIYEFTATRLRDLPLPDDLHTAYAAELTAAARILEASAPAAVLADSAPTASVLDAARSGWEKVHTTMIALQEELDWEVYGRYGLTRVVGLLAPADEVPALRAGERAFEIALAQAVEAGNATSEWFVLNGITPITAIPNHWPEDYRDTVERRLAEISQNGVVSVLEKPEFKRRWMAHSWDAQLTTAVRTWLLDRCETAEWWFESQGGVLRPRPLTISELTDRLIADSDAAEALRILAPGTDPYHVVVQLVVDECVPFHTALRLRDSGLAKRRGWEAAWELQRRVDRLRALGREAEALAVRRTLVPPPPYKSSDFLRLSYWRRRGRYDLPQERFISYPRSDVGAQDDALLGWAGWNDADRALVLATEITDRIELHQAQPADLLPLLSGLLELQPSLDHWHSDFHVDYGRSPSDFFTEFRAETARRLRLSEADLVAWRPAPPQRGRPRKRV